ncbi:MAG: hypothetical protein PHQ39_03720 [Methanothrix soehngenii]|jgi:hypothetical protein|nr:hypothetical protein [Methanothrix soehngenii]
MSDDDAYMDNRPRSPHTDEQRKKFRADLTQRFMKDLPATIERIWELPCLNITSVSKPYPDLLIEARELFVNGYFYSCVAMCGIVGERLIKDVLRNSVSIEKDEKNQRPSEAAFDQLERVEVFGIVNFLNEAGLLSKDAATAARELGALRNAYAHSRGKDSEKDAIEAIKYLHAIVEDTVSIFKGFDLQHGVMIFKDMDTRGDVLRAKVTKLK